MKLIFFFLNIFEDGKHEQVFYYDLPDVVIVKPNELTKLHKALHKPQLNLVFAGGHETLWHSLLSSFKMLSLDCRRSLNTLQELNKCFFSLTIHN